MAMPTTWDQHCLSVEDCPFSLHLLRSIPLVEWRLASEDRFARQAITMGLHPPGAATLRCGAIGIAQLSPPHIAVSTESPIKAAKPPPINIALSQLILRNDG